jgi:hypothetical protein
VKLHLDELMKAECGYWKKRCTVRWIKQGEENTKKLMQWQQKGSEGIALLC